MSDNNEIKDSVIAHVDKVAAEEKFKKEVQLKELLVKDRRLTNELSKNSETDKDREIAKNANYGSLTPEKIVELQKENMDYMYAAKKKMRFMNKEFDDAIPFYRKNLILIGGATGDGKSTTVANIISESISQVDEEGKRRKILVITNEEKAEDVYNRVTCLGKGWHYTNHDKFDDAKVKFLTEAIKPLSSVLTVVDDTYGGSSGVTTTLEGICDIFENLLANKTWYSAVLIDYYQNVDTSRMNPEMNQYQVQAALAKKLDKYKNRYPAPIIVLAQVRPADEANTPFKIRVEGSKSISNVSTCAIELVAHKEELKSQWIIHKSRFNEAVGAGIETGYDMGRHVEYNDEFRAKVQEMIAKREARSFDKIVPPLIAPKVDEPIKDIEENKKNDKGENNE